MSLRNITVLGATGSIGVNTLDVIARHPERYRVIALSGHSRLDLLAAQCAAHKPRYAVVGTAEAAASLREKRRIMPSANPPCSLLAALRAR